MVKRKGFTATGVNTARRIGFYLDLSRGRISQHQVKRVCKVFKDTPEDSLNIVVAHHPFWLPESSLSRSLIGNRDHAIKSFSEAGVDLILGGHIHLAYVEPVKGIIVSHEGLVSVKIEADSVSIGDNGEGIAADEIERIQQPFQRSSSQADGYGLGLDIVRRLCERFGWELDIRSEVGKGTVVRVRF